MSTSFSLYFSRFCPCALLQDGSGTPHEFEDGRAERVAGVMGPSVTWIESEWIVSSDALAPPLGVKTAPEDFDPFSWLGQGSLERERERVFWWLFDNVVAFNNSVAFR